MTIPLPHTLFFINTLIQNLQLHGIDHIAKEGAKFSSRPLSTSGKKSANN